MKTVYYLPGHGGLLSTGLGEGLRSRGFSVAGRETVGDFRRLSFTEQIALVAEDTSTCCLLISMWLVAHYSKFFIGPPGGMPNKEKGGIPNSAKLPTVVLKY